MANATITGFRPIHGMDPQALIPQITRSKIYESVYWKEKCFGLTADTLVDRAVEVKYVGGTYSGLAKPTKFLSLALKLLQIQPADEIIDWLLEQDDFKYLRALAAFYIRLTSKSSEIYSKLEPYYTDYRKLAIRTLSGWDLVCMDQFIDTLLRDEQCLDITLPYLPKRSILERQGLPPRRSPLEDDLADVVGTNNHSDSDSNPDVGQKRKRESSSSSTDASDDTNASPPAHPLHGSKKRSSQPRHSVENKEDDEEEEGPITAPEGSVEYWNQMRAKAGLAPLKE